MNVFVRAALIVFVTAVILLALMFIMDRGKRCPDGQVPVLSEDRWVCVLRGGNLL